MTNRFGWLIMITTGWVTKQTQNKRFDMTQTPNFVFNKNTFAWALDMAWDFKKDLFDCIAGFREMTDNDKKILTNLEKLVSVKEYSERDAANAYLARAAIFCANNPNSPQTKSLIELWQSVYFLFPNKKRPLDSVSAFKCLLGVKDLFQSTKAQYYIMHAFANHTECLRTSDKVRALTMLANNKHATVADLNALLKMRYDMDSKIATKIVEQCYAKIIEMEKLPVEFRNNRPSGNKDYATKYAYKVKCICEDALDAIKILLNINPRYAIEKKKFFDDAIVQAKTKYETKIEMPDINDLFQFPRHQMPVEIVVKSGQGNAK